VTLMHREINQTKLTINALVLARKSSGDCGGGSSSLRLRNSVAISTIAAAVIAVLSG
jgi:hypothetical protein